MAAKSSGTNHTKDVIYIDVDDEITAVIDKVRSSGQKIVALVLPKRATVLQSIVNMKLLKRAADDSKKNLVLITAEAGLLPLAGSVGVHVAKSLSSRPEVPDVPGRADDDQTETIAQAEDAPEDQVDANKTVGELSGDAPKPPADDLDDTIELDDEAPADADDPSTKKSGLAKGLKKFKIPDFNRFRLVFILAIVGIFVLSGLGYAAFGVMPKATITIKTDTSTINTSIPFTLKTAPETVLDVEKGIVLSQLQEVKKTLTQEVPTTGQLNNGDKATGSVTVTAKNCTSLATPKDVPAGTGITTNGKTYITQEKANFSGSGTFDGSCLNFKDTNVAIQAQSGGMAFNVASANFTVVGRSDATATGSASGGTDNLVQVVAQVDIDNAKQKIATQDVNVIKQELTSALIGRNLFVIEATYSVGTPETKLSAELGAEAENLTVTQTISYTMQGVAKADLEKLIEAEAAKHIDTKKQAVTNHGLTSATFALDSNSGDGMTLTMQATAVAGAQLNVETLKQQVAGKKAGDAKEIIGANPGVTDVTVSYSPFWVSSIPKKTSKITITIVEPQQGGNEDDASSL